VEPISLSEKRLQASAAVVHQVTLRVSTLSWETSAELVAAMIKAQGPLRRALSVMPAQGRIHCTIGNSARNQRGSLKKVLLRPTVSASLNLPAGA
jgi:hypothetical protein